jgi:hypothetical protein
MHFLEKIDLLPKLIVDLKSQELRINNFLSEKKFNIDTIFIDDQYKNERELPIIVETKLLEAINYNQINFAIISTEAKSHYAYIKFLLLKTNVKILTDKPLTAPLNVINNEQQAHQIYLDFIELEALNKTFGENRIFILCQRRWHDGFRYIYRLLESIVTNYEIPITNIICHHCDGTWNMPNEFIIRENHPYKYGYGKLFHSGFHFVDLISWLIEINFKLKDKFPNQVEMFATMMQPADFIKIIDAKFYKRFFNTETYNSIFSSKDIFAGFGEIDFNGQIVFKRNERTITNVTLNLLQNGFSRRAWICLPEDTYKSNGRVRHEYLNINVGPIMNIQVHSYQAHHQKYETGVQIGEPGSPQHFDIYIYRNTALIGGQPVEKILCMDLIPREGDDFIGYNEHARKLCLQDFLYNDHSQNESISALKKYELCINLIANFYAVLCKRNHNKDAITNFQLERRNYNE